MMAATNDRLWDILADWEERYRQGQDVAAEELCRDCPELLDELKGHIQALKGMDWLLKPETEDDLAADELSLPFDFGEYTVQEKIGAGGMGQVFKALHRRMERTVALKLLPKAALAPPEAIERFQQEVSSAARLSHPNIVTAFDAGEFTGTPFLSMEYVEGTDLFRLVQESGPLPFEKAITYALQAAQGLAYAHEKGIVHRDIKPGNLILASDGTVKILDLGLARLRPPAHDEALMGTVDYMAPEQTTEPRQADHRSDVYSLGCTLFFLLTGKPLFDARTLIQKVMAHQQNAVPSLRQVRPDVSQAIDAVFQKMVAKKPDDRYQSMAEVIQALQQATSPKHGKKTLWLGGVIAVVLLIAGALWFSGFGLKSGPDKQRRTASQEEIEATNEAIAKLKDQKVLRLNYMPVTDAGLTKLGEQPKLELLELVDAEITDEGVKQLQRYPTLTWLDLSGTLVTDEALKHLRALKRLKVLRLNRLKLTDAGLEHLADLADLELLELQNAAVTDAGLKHIIGLKKLNWLMLSGTEISDAGLVDLAGVPRLRRLHLDRTKVTDAGVAQFRETAPLCGIVR